MRNGRKFLGPHTDLNWNQSTPRALLELLSLIKDCPCTLLNRSPSSGAATEAHPVTLPWTERTKK